MRHDWLTFCQKNWQFIAKHELLEEGQKVIVAVSGGIDSIALLDFFVWLRSTKKIDLVAAHINHRLRGKESDEDEKFIRTLCEKHGIPFYGERVTTKKIAKATKRSIQEIARDIRYLFFDTLKKSLHADRIATAHTANDNAETILINLFRGSGIDGLGGIPVRRDAIVRPFLGVTRKEIEQYARRRKLHFREDSSNLHDDYTRNYIRHNVIPQIERRINPSLIETLSKMSEIFRLNAEFTAHALKEISVADPANSRIDIVKLNGVHPYLRQTAVRQVLRDKKIEPKFDTVRSIVELAENQKGKTVDIDKSFVAERTGDAIVIRKRHTAKAFEYHLSDEGTIRSDEFIFILKKSALPDNKINTEPSIEYVDASALKFPVTVRSWRQGDAFTPIGMKGKKKLSDFFGERKFTTEQKQRIPIVESAKKIVWVAGERLDDRFKLTNTTTEAYQLSIIFNGQKNSQG